MARYSFQIYKNGGIDYRLDVEIPTPNVGRFPDLSRLNRFLAEATNNNLEVAAVDSKTRHDLEQLYMNNSDSPVARKYGVSIFMSEAQREKVKAGKLRRIDDTSSKPKAEPKPAATTQKQTSSSLRSSSVAAERRSERVAQSNSNAATASKGNSGG